MGCSDCAYWKAFDASVIWGECQIRECHSGDGKRMIMNRDEDCELFSPRSEEE